MPSGQPINRSAPAFRSQPRGRKLIALDNDDDVLRQIARVLSGYYVVLQVRQPRKALGLLESDPGITAIVTEQVMSTLDGVNLLETVRTRRPEIRRVMVTGYSDLAAIIAGLHSGAIQSLVRKPIVDMELLAAVCPEAMQRAHVARASA